MADYSSISSEQELLQLCNDGKISAHEYEQLRDAMQTNSQNSGQIPEPAPEQKTKQKSKKKLAIIGFCLMLAGFTLPFLLYYIIDQIVQVSGLNVHPVLWPWVLIGVVLEIAALTIGIIAWPEAFAKATVIWLSIVGMAATFFYSGSPKTSPEIRPETSQRTISEPSSKTFMYELKTVTVNLNEPGATRMMQATVVLVFSEEMDRVEGEKIMDQQAIFLRDWFATYLAGQSVDRVKGGENQERIKAVLKKNFNQMLFPEAKPQVNQIILKDYIIQ